MELSIREWMIIVGIILILAILFDGFRRVRNERRGKIRMSLNKQYQNLPAEDDTDPLSSELPNGGARVVLSRKAPVTQQGVTKEAAAENDEDVVDIDFDDYPQTAYDDEVDDEAFTQDDTLVRAERKHNFGSDEIDLNGDVIELDDEGANPIHGLDDEIDLDPYDPDHQTEELSSDPLFEGYDLPPNKQHNPALANPEDKEFIRINVKSLGDKFAVKEIKKILNACDCRLGDLNIFHRHEFANQQGAIQFSVANMVEPGHFASLDEADQFTPGISFFMAVPGPQKPLEAFDCMVETAKYISRTLNGEMQDETRSIMTAQTLEHCRQSIIELERRRLMAKAD